MLKGHEWQVWSVDWSPDGRRIASAGMTARLWQADGTPGPVWRGDWGGVQCIAWGPDSHRYATGSRHGTVRLWEVPMTPGPVMKAQGDHIDSLAWTPDGRSLASASNDSTIVVWDTGTAEPEWTAVLLPNRQSVTFSAAGQILHGDPDVIEENLIYLVEKPSGAMELLRPSEFRTRVLNGES